MALLTDDMQGKLVNLLVSEGLVTESILKEAQSEAATANKPLLGLLTEKNIVDDELLTHAIAQVSGVPYVDLTKSIIDQSILGLLPEDIAERFMAGAIGRVDNRVGAARYFGKNRCGGGILT